MAEYNMIRTVDYIFPTPIHCFDIEGFENIKNKLIDYAYDFKKREPIGESISNQGGWQSPDFMVTNKDDLLHEFIIDCLNNFSGIKETVKYSILSWININHPGSYNTKHVHPSCNMSGVVWIKSPKNCGRIEFENPTIFQDYDLINAYVDEFKDRSNYHHSFAYKPIEGRFLVFPSHLVHRVEENKSNEDRISVSFNIKLW